MASPCIPTDTVIDAVADDDGTCAWPGDALDSSDSTSAWSKIMLLHHSVAKKLCCWMKVQSIVSVTSVRQNEIHKWVHHVSQTCLNVKCKTLQSSIRPNSVWDGASHWEPEDCGEVRDRSCGQEAPDHFDLGPGGKVSSGKLSRRKFLAKSA